MVQFIVVFIFLSAVKHADYAAATLFGLVTAEMV